MNDYENDISENENIENKTIYRKNYKYTISNVVRKLGIAWIIAAIFMYLQVPETIGNLGETTSYLYMSGWLGMLVGIFVFVPLLVYPLFFDEKINVERCLLLISFLVLACLSVKNSISSSFVMMLMLITILLVVYVYMGWKKTDEENAVNSRSCAILTVGLISFAFCTYLSLWTVYRVKTHATPTYDFGIFAHMFHNMKAHGTMVTTLERKEAMSHLCIHVSPIFYLLLPFYFIISTPEMIQFLQAVVLTTAFVPLWKLARNNKWGEWETVFLCVLLALYPAYMGGASYDIHENIFLTPLLLWLFYFLEKKNTKGIFVSAILTLLVKEDAAVYVAVVALYVIALGLCSSKDKSYRLKKGGILFFGSVIYFFGVTTFLKYVGDGVMSRRYRNFIYDDSESLVTVIKAVLIEPMKVLYECVDAKKLPFIWLTLGILGGLPLLTRRYERYILLIPYVLINLMVDYESQFSIFNHYVYGVIACFFYLVILNYKDIKESLPKNNKNLKLVFIIVPIVLTTLMFYKNIWPKGLSYVDRYNNAIEVYQAREEMMKKIPSDKKVAASTFFTAELSNRDYIYDIKHSKLENVLSADYIFADYGEKECYERYKTYEEDNGYEAFVTLLKDNGYRLSEMSDYGIDIYVK